MEEKERKGSEQWMSQTTTKFRLKLIQRSCGSQCVTLYVHSWPSQLHWMGVLWFTMNLLFSISISLSLDLGNKRLGFCVSAFFRRVCVCVIQWQWMSFFFAFNNKNMNGYDLEQLVYQSTHCVRMKQNDWANLKYILLRLLPLIACQTSVKQRNNNEYDYNCIDFYHERYTVYRQWSSDWAINFNRHQSVSQ